MFVRGTDGAHTEEVLREIGLDPMPLLARGAAANSWSTHYLPAAPTATPKGVPDAITTSAATAGATANARASAQEGPCPVCLGAMVQPIRLSCTHALCADCARRCSDAGHKKCPVCRHPHLLDPKLLGARRDAWRAAYGGWRKGAASGAAGEVEAIVTPRGRAATPSRHFSLAGELIRCGSSLPNLTSMGDFRDVAELPPIKARHNQS